MFPRLTLNRAQGRHRWLVAVAVVAPVLAGLITLSSAWRFSRLGPEPNGLDDLIRAGASIRGDWPNRGQIAEADPAELRSFVANNRAALDLARVGLSRDCLVVFENSEAGLATQGEHHRRLILLCRLLAADRFASEAEGRIEAVWRSDLYALRVAQSGSQGGMLAHASMCWSIGEFALQRLRKLKDRLDANACRAIIAGLADLDRRRVEPDDLVRRWDEWLTGSWSLPYRTMLWLNGMYRTEELNQRTRARSAADKIARSFRFLMAELAIHAYVLDRRQAPRSLADLVPAYLDQVPIDPNTGQALDYPKTPDGRLATDPGTIR